MYSCPKSLTLALALLCLPTNILASPQKSPGKVKPEPAPTSHVLRIIPTRVTVFYSYRDKKTGQLHPMAMVSKTVTVKVVKPEPKNPHPNKSHRKG